MITVTLIVFITYWKPHVAWIALTILLGYCAVVEAQSNKVFSSQFEPSKTSVPKPSTTPPTYRQSASDPQSTRRPKSKIIHSRIGGFSIPFQVDADDATFVEVHLYMSANQGATWEFLNRQPTRATEFPFQANGEGEYWFAIKTLDRNRRLLPHGDPQPELRIIVDTTLPKLEMTAAADPAGRIVCRWNASDIYLNPKSLQLQYKPTDASDHSASDDSQWQTVTVNSPSYSPGGIYVDQLAFWPDTKTQTLDVRIAISDQAGNMVSSVRRLSVPTPSWRHSPQSTARPTDRPPVDPSRFVSAAPKVDASPSASAGQSNPNDPQWKQAFYSKLRPQITNNGSDAATSNRTAVYPNTVPRAIFQDNPYAKASNSPKPQPNSIQQPKTPTVTPKPRSEPRTAMLIGSDPQYADPPVPSGWTINSDDSPQRPVQTRSTNVFQQPFQPPPQPPSAVDGSGRRSNPTSSSKGADIWQSTVQRSANQPQTSVGSTLSPDHRMLPIASGGSSPRTTDSILPNTNEIENAGDQWVSRSSTQFPRNQYRGLDSTGLPQHASSKLVPAIDGQTRLGHPGTASPNRSTFPSEADSGMIGHMRNTGFSRLPTGESHGQNLTQSRGGALRSPAARTSALPPSNVGRASINGPTKANTQIISTKRFRLNYDINAIDPSGVGKVDLYITQNQGRSWTLWGQDPDNQSPFPVEVQDQGLYGFRVVVHSKDGLVGVGPSSGDDADMWVRVDTQPPLVQITSVPYGRGDEAGQLVINYRASDDFLVLRPVRLSYSRSPQGPWTIIEDNLRNDGRYLWRVNRSVADRIFLKIDAIDSAGNVGTHRLSQSVDVSGLIPRGTIRGVEPVGK